MNLFLVKSNDGKYYRSKGFSGAGQNWVDDPLKAKIFTTQGKAQSVVSWWLNNAKATGLTIVKLTMAEEEAIKVDESEVKLRKLKSELRRAKNEQRVAAYFDFQNKSKHERAIKALQEQIDSLTKSNK